MPILSINLLDYARATEGGGYVTSEAIVGWASGNERAAAMRFHWASVLAGATLNSVEIEMRCQPSFEVRSEVRLRDVNDLPANTNDLINAGVTLGGQATIASSNGIAQAGDVVIDNPGVPKRIDVRDHIVGGIGSGQITSNHPICFIWRPFAAVGDVSHTLVSGDATLIVDYTPAGPPTVTSAVISNDGQSITLTWSTAVTVVTGTGYLQCQYDQSDITLSSAGTSSTTHTYSLSRRIDTAETPTLFLAANVVTDAGSNNNTALNGGPVTNGSSYVMPSPVITGASLDRLGRLLTVFFDQPIYYQPIGDANEPFAHTVITVDSSNYPNKTPTVTREAIYPEFHELTLVCEPSHTDDVTIIGRHNPLTQKIVNAADRGASVYSDFAITNLSRVVGGQHFIVMRPAGSASASSGKGIVSPGATIVSPEPEYTPTIIEPSELSESQSIQIGTMTTEHHHGPGTPVVISAETSAAVGRSYREPAHLIIASRGSATGDPVGLGNSNMIIQVTGRVDVAHAVDVAGEVLVTVDSAPAVKHNVSVDAELITSAVSVVGSGHSANGPASMIVKPGENQSSRSASITSFAVMRIVPASDYRFTGSEISSVAEFHQLTADPSSSHSTTHDAEIVLSVVDTATQTHTIDPHDTSVLLKADTIVRGSAAVEHPVALMLSPTSTIVSVTEFVEGTVQHEEQISADPFVTTAAPGEIRTAIFRADSGTIETSHAVDPTAEVVITPAAGDRITQSHDDGVGLLVRPESDSETNRQIKTPGVVILRPDGRSTGNVSIDSSATVLVNGESDAFLETQIRLEWKDPAPTTRQYRTLVVIQFQYPDEWDVSDVSFYDPSGVRVPHMIRANDKTRKRLKVILQPYHRPGLEQPILMRVRQ